MYRIFGARILKYDIFKGGAGAADRSFETHIFLGEEYFITKRLIFRQKFDMMYIVYFK